jgi:hypothetical protein
MKRSVLLGLFLMSFFTLFAQGFLKSIDGPVTIMDNIKINVGDTLLLGQGSSPNRNFLYIFSGDNYAAPNSIASKRYIVQYLKFKIDKRIGDKTYYAVIKLGGLIGSTYTISLESAIRYGEVIGLNDLDFTKKSTGSTTVVQNKLSGADELKKYKALLDQGVITQSEFDAQKKKILDEK